MKIAALSVLGKVTPTKPVPVTTKPTPGKSLFLYAWCLFGLCRITYTQYENSTIFALHLKVQV